MKTTLTNQLFILSTFTLIAKTLFWLCFAIACCVAIVIFLGCLDVAHEKFATSENLEFSPKPDSDSVIYLKHKSAESNRKWTKKILKFLKRKIKFIFLKRESFNRFPPSQLTNDPTQIKLIAASTSHRLLIKLVKFLPIALRHALKSIILVTQHRRHAFLSSSRINSTLHQNISIWKAYRHRVWMLLSLTTFKKISLVGILNPWWVTSTARIEISFFNISFDIVENNLGFVWRAVALRQRASWNRQLHAVEWLSRLRFTKPW